MSDPAVPEVPALVTWPEVEILAAGTWKLSTGETTFTREDLAAAVDAASCPAVGSPVIKLGHNDKRFVPGDGEPAIGRVTNLTLTTDGNKVTGDLAGMPGWLGEILPSAYPQRSIEGAYDLVCQIGHVHPFAITALALLGVTPPGVGVLADLEDVAALYGVTATGQTSARAWALESGDPMAGTVIAAGVTSEDVRRAYYDSPNVSYAMWITELQLDPPQLIVADESTNKVYRVPVTIKGGEVTFGDAVEVSVEYMDVPAKKAAGKRVRFASAAESRAGIEAAWDAGTAEKNLGDSPTSAQLKKLYALPGSTKSDSKLPHHDVSSDGTVGAANDAGCSAAIGAINGAHGGLKGVSAADAKKAYNHLAAHLKADGKDVPDYAGPSASAKPKAAPALKRLGEIRQEVRAQGEADDDVTALIASLDAALDEASELAQAGDDASVQQALALITAAEAVADELMDLLGIPDPDENEPGETAASRRVSVRAGHGPCAEQTTHDHAHSAFGSQGGDQTHTHEHSHPAGTASHKHAHAKAGGTPKGATEMNFSDEQLAAIRAKLGKKDDDELTPEEILAAIADPGGAVSAKLPEGVIAIDKDVWEATQRRIAAGEAARERQLRNDRDTEIAAAMRAGKFPLARKEHWERLWNADPEGTRVVLAGLTPGVVPLDDIGVPGGPGDELLDDEYRRIFPPDYTRAKAE